MPQVQAFNDKPVQFIELIISNKPLLDSLPTDIKTMSVEEFECELRHNEAFTWSENMYADAALIVEFRSRLGLTQDYIHPFLEAFLMRPENKLAICKIDEKIGYAAFAREDIKEGEIVCIYTGELIKLKQADATNMYVLGFTECEDYLFYFDQQIQSAVNEDQHSVLSQYGISAKTSGSISRFLSDLPDEEECQAYGSLADIIATANLVPCLVIHRGFPIIYFKASRDIKLGEQVGFSYGSLFWHKRMLVSGEQRQFFTQHGYPCMSPFLHLQVKVPDGGSLTTTISRSFLNHLLSSKEAFEFTNFDKEKPTMDKLYYVKIDNKYFYLLAQQLDKLNSEQVSQEKPGVFEVPSDFCEIRSNLSDEAKKELARSITGNFGTHMVESVEPDLRHQSEAIKGLLADVAKNYKAQNYSAAKSSLAIIGKKVSRLIDIIVDELEEMPEDNKKYHYYFDLYQKTSKLRIHYLEYCITIYLTLGPNFYEEAYLAALKAQRYVNLYATSFDKDEFYKKHAGSFEKRPAEILTRWNEWSIPLLIKHELKRIGGQEWAVNYDKQAARAEFQDPQRAEEFKEYMKSNGYKGLILVKDNIINLLKVNEALDLLTQMPAFQTAHVLQGINRLTMKK